MNFLDYLDGRKAVRHFDQATSSISDAEITEILAHAAKAPSNNNFQPWRVIVIKNKKIQQKLQTLAAGQQQVASAAAVFLLLGTQEGYNIEKILQFNLKHHILEASQVAEKRKRIELYFALHPEDRQEEGLRLDVGLFAMNLMHVLRAYGYDSVPMRGVDFDKVMQFLQLPSEWSPILLLPAGKALKEGHQQFRNPVASFSQIIN
ncbi:nitroreductase family protein [Liquorilactobacillus satsumensis]|uniref:nitroreductase family protein n=1 Tax=Liquorilactobacillus satsumensis TaxID=259059 RepID=UPI0039E86F64